MEARRVLLASRLINDLNDALAWGLVPPFLAAPGAAVAGIGLVAAL